MANNKKLKILIVGMSPAIIRRVRLKGIPLAPILLKAYADSYIKKDFPNSVDIVDIEVMTFFVEETNHRDIADKILSEKPDVVAFSVYIWNYHETMECAKIIKERNKQITIICGGPQVSPLAIELMREHLYIDVIPYTATPGEVIFYQFVKSIIEKVDFDRVEAIVYRNSDGSLVKTAPLTEELDYSHNISPYLGTPLSLTPGENYVVVLETSRGCPCDCGYCFYGRRVEKIQYFPLQKVLKEIEIVYKNPDIKYVFFADADILLHHNRAETIINHILQQSKDVITDFDINISHINENTVKLLTQLPNYRFCFGVQTLNPDALSCISRLRPSRDVFIKKIREFRKWAPNADYSIDVMLGLPKDDFIRFKETLDICLSLKPTRVSINYPVHLLPGTRFFEEKDALGLSYSKKFPLCVIETKMFPQKDIEAALKLSLWMDILTYFYPAIARFFHRICENKASGTWINTLEKWIVAIEKKLDIFGHCRNVLDVSVENSVQEWNKLKGYVLRRASEAEGGLQIYHAIKELEEDLHFDAMQNTIIPGVKVFNYLHSQQINSVEFTRFDQLPENIHKGYSAQDIKNIFSRYRQ